MEPYCVYLQPFCKESSVLHQRQIAAAKALEGGTEEGKETLLTKIREAEQLLAKNDVTAEQLEDMTAQLSSAIEAYKKTAVISIEVDTSKTLRDIPAAMFGINHRYHNDGYSSFNAEEGKIEDEFNEYVKEAAFGSIRYPGRTVYNLYDWKRAIGPAEDRKKTIHGNLLSPIAPPISAWMKQWDGFMTIWDQKLSGYMRWGRKARLTRRICLNI